MPGKAVGRAAADLPWLCPKAESLIALAERPTEAAPLRDTAYLVFLLRYARTESASGVVEISHERWLSPSLPEAAAAFLASPRGKWVDDAHPFVALLNRFTLTCAKLAGELARATGRANPEEAALAAQVAALGWHAVADVDADAAAECRDDDRFASNSVAIQVERWGLNHDAIARRLATRWRFPERITSVVGQLNLPLRAAKLVSPDADLFAVVQLAVREAERRIGHFGLTVGADPEELFAHLGTDEDRLQNLSGEFESLPGSAINPHEMPLLPNLLRMAAEARRRNGAALVLRLEERVDRLQHALTDMANTTNDRIREARLRGLAELAAGAGHEINNPLMVIAGHAQRLRQKETDPEREGVLRIIERQTERIASLIKGLMQFARPPRPQRQHWPANDLVRAVRDDLAADAQQRGITLEADVSTGDKWLEADRDQIRQALRAVVINGLEASSEGGSVRLRVESNDENALSFVIEDGGPGITKDQRELIFDPFFCGKSAGRGRGLGLSIAWRLATQNGGTLRYEPLTDGTTRFALTFPRAADRSLAERKSA